MTTKMKMPTLPNVVHVNVEIHCVDSTLINVVNSNFEIHNVVELILSYVGMSHQPNDVFFFYYLLCLFHFYKNTKIQNTFTNIILHKKFMKLKEEKNIYIKLQIF